MDYMCQILNRFNVPDYKDIAPEYFEMSTSSLEEGIRKRKLGMNKKNLSQFLMWKIKKDNWDVSDIISTAFDLELDYLIKYSNRFEWTANKFVGDSTHNEISDLAESIRGTIRQQKQDASVLVKETEDFFWISISLKNLKKIGIFEKPHYLVLSMNGKYFFTKDKRCGAVIKYLTSTLGYEREKRVKLCGRSLSTLQKLLVRKETVDVTKRPVYEGGEAVENEFGIDFTQKKNYLEYYDKCVDNDNDINLQHYTVSSINCCWAGDDNPTLQDLEFKSSITLSGDVARIIRQLPITSIVKPPLPVGTTVKDRSHSMCVMLPPKVFGHYHTLCDNFNAIQWKDQLEEKHQLVQISAIKKDIRMLPVCYANKIRNYYHTKQIY